MLFTKKPPPHKVFDGHNDILLRLYLADDGDGKGFIKGTRKNHLDAKRAGKGGFAGGFFAMFVPNVVPGKSAGKNGTSNFGFGKDSAPPSQSTADTAARGMAAILAGLNKNHPDIIRQCHNRAEAEAAMQKGAIAAMLHLEGAEAILPDCGNLAAYYELGLRSIGPVWSRDNVFGAGVPFDFPASPDTGPGLTDAGRALVRACNALGIMLDVSHLNAAGFRDLAATTEKPIIATHSNSHALCESARNLTAWQLDAIAESGGLVGVNFAVAFLRTDGAHNAATPLETILAHIDGLLARLGEDGVALGSDFDGALIPRAIGDVAGLANLTAAMEKNYGAALTQKLIADNWLRQIGLHIG